jgi:hypothetical protein
MQQEGADGLRTIELNPQVDQSAALTPVAPIPAADVARGGALTEQLRRPQLPPFAATELMPSSPSEGAGGPTRTESSPTNKVANALTIAAPLVEDPLDDQPATMPPDTRPAIEAVSIPDGSASSQLEKEDTEEFGPAALQGVLQPAPSKSPVDAARNGYARSLNDYSRQVAELAEAPSRSTADLLERPLEGGKSPSPSSVDHPGPDPARAHSRDLSELQRSLVDYPRSLVDYPRSLTSHAGDPSVVRRPRTHPAVIAVIAALLIIAAGLVVLNVLLASSDGESPRVTPVSSHVMVSSNPSGARVENAETREALGFTPIDLDPSRYPGLRRVRILSQGFKPAELLLSEQHPRVSVELEPQRR